MKSRIKKRDSKCGTPAGYEAHLRNNERPCSSCLPASDTYSSSEIAELMRALRESDRDKMLWNTYRLTHASFVRLLAEQENRCACCRSSEPGKNGWCIDHDHITGLIRGIICGNCNTGIGMLGDDLAGVQRAVAYLLEHLKRGGYPQDTKPPKEEPSRAKISKVMQECFDLFEQGVVPNKVVVLKKLDPSLMMQIFTAWQEHAAEAPSLRADHRYQIVREEPRHYVCECGFTAHFHDIFSMTEAIEGMKKHVLNEAGKEMERSLALERAISSPG